MCSYSFYNLFVSINEGILRVLCVISEKMEKVLSYSFASGDELIHVTLYDWLIANSLHDRLLEVYSS